MILASQSYEQCRAVFDEYTKVSQHDIEQAIKREMSGDLATGMLTIGKLQESICLRSYGGNSIVCTISIDYSFYLGDLEP